MTDRLEEIVREALERHAQTPISKRTTAAFAITGALRAAGATVPEPKGPVASEEAVLVELAEAHRRDPRQWFALSGYSPGDLLTCRYAVDAAMPLLARDHGYVKAGSDGLLTPEEVERRAREYFVGWHPNLLTPLITALTTRPAPGRGV